MSHAEEVDATLGTARSLLGVVQTMANKHANDCRRGDRSAAEGCRQTVRDTLAAVEDCVDRLKELFKEPHDA